MHVDGDSADKTSPKEENAGCGEVAEKKESWLEAEA